MALYYIKENDCGEYIFLSDLFSLAGTIPALASKQYRMTNRYPTSGILTLLIHHGPEQLPDWTNSSILHIVSALTDEKLRAILAALFL